MLERNSTSPKKRTLSVRVETVSGILGVLTCIITLAVGIGAVAVNSRQFESNGNATCRVLKNMDPDVDPCDNFYQFACGGFVKSKFIPDDANSVGTFNIINDKLKQQLRMGIESLSESNERKPFSIIKNLYNSCMNETAIEDRGLKPFHNVLKKLGGWPVIDGEMWNDGDFDWINLTSKFRDAAYFIHYFIDLSIIVDLKNSSKWVLELDVASLGLEQEYLTQGIDNKIVKAYYSYMVDIAVLLGAERERASTELKESLLFEINLANISRSSAERRNKTELYNPMTLAELTENYPSIPWRTFLANLLPKTITVEEDDALIVSEPSFISELEKLISRTPKRVQANYAMWRATKKTVGYLNADIRKRQLAYWTALGGTTERESRWKECVDLVGRTFPPIVGAMYVKKYFDEDAKVMAVEMVKDIRQQFHDTVQEVRWMDENTRQSALKKAVAMSTYVAYPDELLDDDKLEKVYENLELSGTNYLESILNATFFVTFHMFNQLREPVHNSNWLNHGRSAVVNAFYSSTENSIDFPAGILQGAFFSKDRPRYMNYGAIGVIVGHEITHGFDDQGRQFDEEGNLVNWWTPSTGKSFVEKAQCIIEQYSNYTVEEVGLKLNGINTQSDNIADIGGTKQAYHAYNNWVERNAPEPKLPGLPYSPNQMFWISLANMWCSKFRPETLKQYITRGSHSPPEFRVVGPLSNMPEFSNDFNCPVGTEMNPQNKCSIW